MGSTYTFKILMSHKRHVERRPGQYRHVDATSAKLLSKTTEGVKLRRF
jgi:hypothetical protein